MGYGELLHKSEQRTISPAICVYIDANGLHELNNERGHEAGDLMLRFVAESLMEQFPKGSLCRVGGALGLFKEYYRDPERTHEAWNNGIYYTGDVAWKDEDGYLWFVGRADDVIKSSGYRIGPFEVESALMTHPAVIECAITGVPDEIRGQVVKATIVLAKEYKGKEGEELIKELQNHVKKVTAPYKYPRVIEFVDELPKTISGKIRRVEIRKNDTK